MIDLRKAPETVREILQGHEGENQGGDKPRGKWLLLIIIVAFLIVLALGALGVMAFEIKYKEAFFPGTRIGDIALEGLSREQALGLVSPMVEKIEKDGIKFSYGNTIHIMDVSGAAALSADAAIEKVSYDEYGTVQDAFAVGHSGKLWQDLGDQWRVFLGKHDFKAKYLVNEQMVREALKEQLGQDDVAPADAKPKIVWSGDSYVVEVEQEQTGREVDYDRALVDLKNNLSVMDASPIKVYDRVTEPSVTIDDISNRLADIDQALSSTMPEFVYAGKSWKMNKKKLAGMLEFQKRDGSVVMGLGHEAFAGWFADTVAADIDVEAKNATMEVKDGRVTKLSTHQEGLQSDVDKAYADASAALLSGAWPVEVAVVKVRPEVMTDNVNDLGIKEIIGFGESNFAGSPANRIHNIKNGASKVHGLLVKPGEEFSLIGALGEVDASTGYKPELVIKGNKTTPEYGGGLCQVGTTIFRAAMGSGLPITERRNHSYSVSYYLEDGLPGVDATIYIPHPDVRFVNDTGNYILIQARIDGTKLKFEFWGTKDGRKAERTKPKVWDWVSPAPTKYVETTELKPGEKKCTEAAHKGVKASFDYFITYADGEVKKQNFYSVYKPWQAVCLIGVEAKASSTEPIAGGETPAP